MSRALRPLPLLSLLILAPVSAQAGWIIEWSTVATNSKGERMEAQNATQSIAANRVRMEQPHIVTITDYGQGRFTMLNPAKRYFWSGTVDEYVTETSSARDAAMRERMGNLDAFKKKDAEKAAPAAAPTIDLAKLPPVSVTASGISETIAGYEATKYEVRVDGTLYEELWIAPLAMGSDLDTAKFLAQQQKLAAGRLGRAGRVATAVYRSPEYGKLFENGFALKAIAYHGAGNFQRSATAVKQGDVSAAQFEAPDGYRKVRLSDMLDPPPTPAAASPGQIPAPR